MPGRDTGLAMWCAAASASAAAMPTFTVVGIIVVLNGGETNSHAECAHEREGRTP